MIGNNHIKLKLAAGLLIFVTLMGYSTLATLVYGKSVGADRIGYGGGYAASDQIAGVSYMTQLYDASNGLPTSDANCILGASDGYIWIGGYSGIFRYDGRTFEKLDTSEGLSSGRGLFEDSKGRIWVATNDNGVVVIDGDSRTHFSYEEGLTSSSVRSFAESGNGDVFIGTTAGVCYVDTEGTLHVLNDKRLTEERILRLISDRAGRIYGQTSDGVVFAIDDHSVSEIYKSSELGMAKITSILTDPDEDGKLWFGTDSDIVYYGQFGDNAYSMKKISVRPMDSTHWMSYDCGRVWVTSLNTVGYINGTSFTVVEDIPHDSGIEMITSDYQGNLWVASSTKGVIKITANSFVDLTHRCGLEECVTNAACFHDGRLFVGTDEGLHIIDDNNRTIDNELTEFIGQARVRCISEDAEGNLWLGTFTDNLGLVCIEKNGSIRNYTVDDGLLSNQIRCIAISKDGSVLVGSNGGLDVIKNGKVTRAFGAEAGIKNTVFLTVCEGDEGEIYAGSDGDGIYLIKGEEISKIGRDEGLTSDVVSQIKKDGNGVYWIITSNSIQYMKDGEIREVTSFPYNYNYDLYFADNEMVFVVSSSGIQTVLYDELINDSVNYYRLYTMANGLPYVPTASSYSAIGKDKCLYVPGRSGVCRVNIEHINGETPEIKTAVGSVYFGDEKILPDENGIYTIPNRDSRVVITASVLDYSSLNPFVKVFIEGMEEDGIASERDRLTTLEYTGLKYGDYDLHIQVFDHNGNELADDVYRIEKKARFTELLLFRILIFATVAALAAFIVWRVMGVTIVKRQYEEIRKAKEEAEQANVTKTRFLANMSHEIRTPINTIMGMNEMVLREDATDVPKPYFMSMMGYALDIREASETLLSLINDLLDMSKIESGKMHTVDQEYDTQELLRSIVSMIRSRSTEKQLTFDVIIDEVLPKKLYGDSQKIKQIVLNLLTNALKYTQKGGFALEVSMTERHDDICRLSFSVKDTGIGVKKEDMEKLFSAYERLDEEKNSGIQGTGLGLDISRKLAEIMGGTLVCESEYGKGSEFILTVDQKITDRTPIGIFAERDESKVQGAYVPKFIAPDADILVVDDTPMNLSVIKGLLKSTRVFVSTASSGEECLARIKDTHFDVVLLDHMMPGMDGVETLERIRETDKDLVVYALTANTAVDESYYISKGFNGYISKPVDSEILERTLMKHIPDKIMEKPETAVEKEALTQMPESMSWIYETEGISAEDGIKNSGGIENYIFSLKLFFDTIDDNAKVIKEAYDCDNIRLFTIKVHALKSSARIIGARDLSLFAEKLEDAGNIEDRSFIEENALLLLEEYEKFREKLKKVHEDADNNDKTMISDEELKDAFSALSDVIPQMDYDSVEMILDSLSEYQLPEDKEETVTELKRMLKVFDWDGMEALITKGA